MTPELVTRSLIVFFGLGFVAGLGAALIILTLVQFNTAKRERDE